MPPSIYAMMPMLCKAVALKQFKNGQVILNIIYILNMPKKENIKNGLQVSSVTFQWLRKCTYEVGTETSTAQVEPKGSMC